VNKKIVLTGVVLTLLISGSAIAFGGKNQHRNPVNFLERVIDLSDNQVEQIESIHAQQKAQFESQFPRTEGEKHHGKKRMIKAMMQLDPESADYQSKLEQLANEAAAQAKAKILLRGQAKQEIYAVLSDQQKAELRAKQEKIRKKMEKRAQRRAENN